MQIKLNVPEDNIHSHLTRLRIFYSELRILRSNFYGRLREKMKDEEDFYTKNNLPKPVVSVLQLSNDFADPEINLYFKSFLFVYRQYVEKVFRIIFLLKPKYEDRKAHSKICDASAPGRFTRFIENLLNDEYIFDDEILETLKKYSDLLILSRLLRNSLKLQGTFNTVFVDNNPIIVCPVLAKDKKDKSLKLLKQKFSVELENLKNFTMSPAILDEFISSTEEIFKVLNKKVDEKDSLK